MSPLAIGRNGADGLSTRAGAQLHVPAVHVVPARHTFEQVPQWAESLDTSAHTLPQSICPDGHTHAMFTHDRPPEHTVPHVPQLALLV
jgi:hypothetical protein